MKSKLQIICQSAVFILIGSIFFLKIQAFLTPSWNVWGRYGEYAKEKIRSIQKLDAGELDALFLGTSHVHFGVSPMELYRQYGIASYSLGTTNQPLNVSYFLLEKAYETQQIKNVFLDVSHFTWEADNASYRYVMDNLPLCALKWRMAKDYAQHEWSDGFLSAIFPIIKFHDTWESIQIDELSGYDDLYYTFGQAIFTSEVLPTSLTRDEMNNAAYFMNEYKGEIRELVNGVLSETEQEESLYEPEILEESKTYLMKIRDLCAAHGSNLVLIKIPTRREPQLSGGAWTKIKSEIVSQFAGENQLQFWDLEYDTEALINFETDSFDGGDHLNPIGAEKVSRYIGERMVKEDLAVPKENPVYEEALKKYEKVYSIVKLQSTTDFARYMECLKDNLENWTVSIACAQDYITGLTDENKKALTALGLLLASQGEFSDSYAAVISCGEVLYEALSDYEINYEIERDGIHFLVNSRNWWITTPGASIQINGKEYSQSKRGLNIVVYDHTSGHVIDSVAFDTFEPEKTCIRNANIANDLLHSYVLDLCFDGR